MAPLSPPLTHSAALAAIAGGAVLGAWARYGLSIWLNQSPRLPLGTLVANLIGAFLIGAALAWLNLPSQAERVPEVLRLALITGFLGALTTFSSFSAEVVQSVQRGDLASALAIAAVHLFGSLSLTALGYYLVKASA